MKSYNKHYTYVLENGQYKFKLNNDTSQVN